MLLLSTVRFTRSYMFYDRLWLLVSHAIWGIKLGIEQFEYARKAIRECAELIDRILLTNVLCIIFFHDIGHLVQVYLRVHLSESCKIFQKSDSSLLVHNSYTPQKLQFQISIPCNLGWLSKIATALEAALSLL